MSACAGGSCIIVKKQAVLCVDDEAIILISLIQELKNAFGETFIYEKALNADQAFEVIDALVSEGIEIILIVSDWFMPGMKGDEFLEIVQKSHPSIKAIVLTGHADAAAIDRLNNNSSVRAVLKKPWDSEVLKNMVSSIWKENCSLSDTR